MSLSAYLPAAGKAFDPLAVRQHLAQIAARGLAGFAGAFGVLMLVLSLAEVLMKGSLGGLAGQRLLLGGFIGIGAVGGWLLLRRGWPHWAATVTVVIIASGIAWHGWAIGLGLYTTALAGLCLLVTVAGMLLGMRAALGLTAGYAAVVALLAYAEVAGWVQGRAALGALPLADRVLGHALLGCAGLLGALLLHRMVTSVIAQAVREQQRLAELLTIGIDYSWEMDRRGRLTYLSPSFEATTGHRIAAFMRLAEPGGPQPLANDEYRAFQDDLRAGRAYRDRRITMRATDGSELHVVGNGRPMLDAEGRVERWIGVARNVTREVEAERRQQRTQTMFDRMIAMSPDAICVARAAGQLVLVNAGFEAMSGLPAAALIGRRLDESGLWTKAESIRLRDALAEHGVVRDFRSLFVPRGGGAARLVTINAAAFDWDGEAVAVVSARDITDHERARVEGDAILDHASVGIALVRGRSIERANPQMELMLGFAAGTLAGTSVQRLADDRAGFRRLLRLQRLQRARADGAAGEIDHDFRRPDGSLVTLRLRARAIDRTRPVEAGTIWVAEDVTERRRRERELADARLQAEAASRAKSAFLATMSHEIRTPLNGVLGLSRLLQDPQTDPARREQYLAHLGTAASQLSGIVSNVLDLSKIEAGSVQIEAAPFDLHELLRTQFDSFAVLGRERGLAMALELAPTLPQRVVGDAVRLRQILSNYLGNALKFTSAGGIRVSAAPQAAASGRIRFEVEDSGIGVEPAEQGRLFHPFAQADSSTTRRFGGTGLGLSICRDLAELMGGAVGMRSDGVRGSCFWVELPLVAVAGAADPAAQTAAPVNGPSGLPRLQGRLVLVAEDNPVNLLIVRALLQRHGAEVIEAQDGQAAVELARANAARLDAVLMDLHMPVLDGLAATRALRAEPLTQALPIHALSAAVLDHERRAALAAGMSSFIGKPVDEGELLRALA